MVVQWGSTYDAHYDSILVSASVCIKDFLLSALKYGYTNILQSKHLGYSMFLGYEPRPRKLWRMGASEFGTAIFPGG